MKKKVLICFVMILILVLVGVVIFGVIKLRDVKPNLEESGEIEQTQNKEQNINQNRDNAEVIEYFSIDKVKKVGAIEFSNIKIGLINNSKCEFTADIKNTSMEFVKGSKVSIKVKDENGKVKASFGGVITDLAGLEPNKFKTYVLSNITYAKDIDIEVVNE